MGKNKLVLIKPRLSALTVIEEGTLLGFADQPGIQRIGVEMLGMQEEEATDFALMDFTSYPSSSPSSNSKFNEKEVLDVKEEEVTETVFDNRSSDEENSLANDRFKKNDSIYKFKISEIVTSLTTDEKDAPETNIACVEKPKKDRSNAPLIQYWDTDSDNDSVFRHEPIPTKNDFMKAGEPVESAKHVKPVKPVKTAEQTKKSKKFSSSPNVDRKYWNGKMTQKLGLGFGFTKKACFVCCSISHLIKDCTFHDDRMAKKFVLPTNVGMESGHRKSRQVWNNVQRLNHQNKFAPTAVFTRSGRIPVSAAKPKATTSTSATKPVNTAGPKQSVHFSKSSNTLHNSHSPIRRTFYNTTRRNSTERVNTVRSKAVSAGTGNKVVAVKTSMGCVWKPRVNDIDQLSKDNMWICTCVDYVDPQGRLNKTKCLVLSPNFKLLDESQVLLRVPKQSNMYSFDLHNVVPSGDLTCLFAKVSIDESNLWHMRLGHVNFKTMNKLVTRNLVRGLPSKIFSNDHSCVACQKGKQHKATFNIACYVINMALVTKTHNKTPYELLNGKKHRLDFMRPFGCPVTILNTYDPLGKFEGNQTDKNEGPQDTTGNVDQMTKLKMIRIRMILKTVKEPVNKEDQASRDELDRLMSQEKEASNAADALRKESEEGCMDLRGATKAGSTNLVNTVNNPVNAAIQSVGAEADFNNMESSTIVSPIPTHRVHLDHRKDQILGDPKSAVQTREMAKKSFGVHAFVSYIHKQRRTNHKDYENCLFACFISQLEPKKKAIGRKWVYINKKDERGIVVRNKARLVAQGHRQEEAIDYDEVFAPVAGIEAIRIFLDFTSFMGFIVYQMDVKQSKEGIFISQDKYVAEILKKFYFSTIKIVSTPIETQKRLVKDEEAGDVTPKLLHLYAVKRIFRRLKGQPKLGLWYPRDSQFDLEAYSDSDYAGANLDK
nr:hypothetical protein [Tanacetum cinerariifolium]